MFAVSQIHKSHCFDIYTFVFSQYSKIKTTKSFTSFSQISSEELILISNTTMECLEKLSEVSAFIERKINDTALNSIIISQLNKLDNFHNNLLDEIYSFNQISNDVTILIKEISTLNYTPDTINYLYFNIINKYKQLLLKIFNSIIKINVYLELLKSKGL